MANIREAIKLISGEEPTPERVARIQAIAHSLDIPMNDAMLPILVALDTYQGTFTKLPDEMKRAAEKFTKDAETTAQARINAAAAEIVAQSGPLLVDTFRKDLGKTLWSRSVWAAAVILMVMGGSYLAGEVDIWWHSRQLNHLQAKEKVMRDKIAAIRESPAWSVIENCDGSPCVPIITNQQIPNLQTYTISSGKFKGDPLGILNMQAIKGLEAENK